MKILITTPTGKVGSEVARLLRSKNLPHRVALRDPSRAEKGSDAIAFDYNSPDAWAAALRDIDRVYLAAVGDQSAEPEKAFIDLASSLGVKRIVKLAAAGIEETDTPLRQVERHIESKGIEWTFLHPTWFFQNFSTAHAASIKAGVLAEPVDDRWAAFIDTRDIAAVAVEALTTNSWIGQILTLTGNEKSTRADVAAEITKQLGRPVVFQNLTDAQFRENAGPYLPPSYLELLSALYGWVRQGSSEFQTDTVEKVLGRKPIGLAQFVSDHLNVWR